MVVRPYGSSLILVILIQTNTLSDLEPELPFSHEIPRNKPGIFNFPDDKGREDNKRW